MPKQYTYKTLGDWREHRTTCRLNKEIQRTQSVICAVSGPPEKIKPIKNYLTQRHKEEPDNPKYFSLSSMMIALLEKETGLYIRGISFKADEATIKAEWLKTDPLNLGSSRDELMKEPEFREFLNERMERMWTENKEEIIATYQRHTKGDE